MKDCKARLRSRAALWTAGAAMLLAIGVGLAGCATKKPNPDVIFENTGIAQSTQPVHATIQITYAKKGDTLGSAKVTKFFGAQVLTNEQTRSGKQATLIRFDGGVPIWDVQANHALTARFPGIGHANFAPKQVRYAKVPPNFVQVIPDGGPPESLERGGFYVFEIERASGARNWEAVKVRGDGSLEAFAAEPRAGSSYILCCGVPSDFTEPVVTGQDLSEFGTPDSGN